MFWEDILGRIFLEGFFWEEILVYVVKVIWIWKAFICLSRFWFLSRYWLNKEGGRKEGQEFRSLEVRHKLIALINKVDLPFITFNSKTVVCSKAYGSTSSFDGIMALKKLYIWKKVFLKFIYSEKATNASQK